MTNQNTGKPEQKKAPIQLEEIASQRVLVDGRGALIKIPFSELSRREFQIIAYYDPQSNTVSCVVYGAPREDTRSVDFGAGFASQSPTPSAQYIPEGCSPLKAFNNLFAEIPKRINRDNIGL